jgi:hypothetical protein
MSWLENSQCQMVMEQESKVYRKADDAISYKFVLATVTHWKCT